MPSSLGQSAGFDPKRDSPCPHGGGTPPPDPGTPGQPETLSPGRGAGDLSLREHLLPEAGAPCRSPSSAFSVFTCLFLIRLFLCVCV